MRVLTFTTLFPNAERPRHGIFIETRLRHLLARHPVQSRVVAPVPWFPFKARRFGDYARHARVPRQEMREGIGVSHPRYPVIPKVGMSVAPYLLAAWTLGELARIRRDGFDFDLIDAHYFYPDGVAAAIVAKQLGKPLVITARGTDISHIPQHPWPRRLIRKAAEQADAVITVCAALKDAIGELGCMREDVQVLRNGVDLDLFHPPPDREALRASMGLDRTTLLSVGNLVELKGHHLVVEALLELPHVDLVVVGEGEERARLERQVSESGLTDRVRLVGVVPQARLRDYYGAADALVLASSREGWANVLLESMACGTPVVATPVWGTPEVVSAPAAGRLTESREPAAIAAACRELLEAQPSREATRRYAERFSWSDTADGLWHLFDGVVARAASNTSPLRSF